MRPSFFLWRHRAAAGAHASVRPPIRVAAWLLGGVAASERPSRRRPRQRNRSRRGESLRDGVCSAPPPAQQMTVEVIAPARPARAWLPVRRPAADR